MIKTFLSRATVGVVACFSLFMTSCIQEEYKISEETLDLEVTVFQEGVALPIGSTDKITIGKVLELYGTDEIKEMLPVGEDGAFAFNMADNFDFSEELKDLSANFSIAAIADAMDMPFDLSSVNVSDVKVEAMEVGYEQKLSDVIEPVEFTIDPITMEPISETADISEYIPDDEELQIEIPDYEYSGVVATVNDITIAENKLALLEQYAPNLGYPDFTRYTDYEVDKVIELLNHPIIGVDLGFEIYDSFTMEEPLTMSVEVTLPDMIKSVEEIHLNEGAKIRISLDLSDNLFFTSGNVVPHVDLDVHEIFCLPGNADDNHIVADFYLNKDNGYAATNEFVIEALNIDYENDIKPTASGALKISKDLSLSPTFQLNFDQLMTSVGFLNDHNGGPVDLTVKVEFVDFFIDDVAVTVDPIEVSFNQTFPLEIKQDLPDMVTGIEEVTFVNNADVLSGLKLTLDVNNVDRIPGLDLGFETLELEFPQGIVVEGADAENRLNVEIGSLSDGKTIKTVVVNGITLDPTTQPEGAIEFKGDVKINAVGRVGVKEGDAIHTKNLPREAKDDIAIKVDAVATFELDNFRVGFEGYEYVIEDTETGNKYIEKTIEFEVTKEVAELGEVKIVPETPDGNVPVIDINIELPATKLNIGPVGEGLVIDFPDMIKFGDINMEPVVEYSYDAVNNVLTFVNELPSTIQIPIESLMASAKETVKDGEVAYVVGDTFKIYGTIGVAEGIVVKEDIDALTSEDAVVSFMANVPEMVPSTVSIKTYQASIDKQSFEIGKELNLSDLPEMLVAVDKIELDNVYLVLDVKANGIDKLIKEADVDVALNISLPEQIMIEKNENVNIDEHNNLTVNASLVGENIEIAPLHVIGLDLAGVDLSDENALKDLKIELEGNITVSNATIDMEQFENTKLSVDVNYSLSTVEEIPAEESTIKIGKVSGYIDYTHSISEEIALDALIEVIESDNLKATLDLNRFSLALELTTNLSASLQADINIIPFKNGEPIEGKELHEPIYISMPESNGEAALIRYWISNYKKGQDPYMPEGYEHISMPILSLISLNPEKLQLELTAGTDPDALCSIAPSEEGYVLSAAYAFNLPLEFGENLKLEFSQTIEDLPEMLGTVLQYTSFGLIGEIESSLPLELDMTFRFLDAEGNEIELLEEAGHQTIKPGTITGEAVKSDLSFIVGIKQGVDVSGIDKLELVFKAKSLPAAPIKEDTYIKINNLQALIPQGVTVDLSELGQLTGELE